MGIFGDQVSDGAIPKAKLDAALQAEIDAGGGGIGGLENKTADFSITSADDGKFFTNAGASGKIVGTADAGLPVGFSFSVFLVEAQVVEFQPESGGRAGYGNPGAFAWGAADAAVSMATQGSGYTWVKTGSGWVPFPDGTNTGLAVTQLLVRDLTETTPDGLVPRLAWVWREVGTGTPVTAYTARAYAETVPSPTLLGTYVGSTGWSDGSDAGESRPFYMEIQNTHANPIQIQWGGGPSQIMTVNFDLPSGSVDLEIGNGPGGDFTVNLGDTARWWVDTAGKVYDGGSLLTGWLSWPTALSNGPV